MRLINGGDKRNGCDIFIPQPFLLSKTVLSQNFGAFRSGGGLPFLLPRRFPIYQYFSGILLSVLLLPDRHLVELPNLIHILLDRSVGCKLARAGYV